ncbi:MAG: glycosyltransferase [Chloroflexi bacterium]|nr:MAG: glycosyltransferase [Chloroflexota bacterium]
MNDVTRALPRATVIVLAWNGVEYLDACLRSVLAQDHPDFEVLVVDNGSTDGSGELVATAFPQVRLIRNERNLGFAAGNNVGLRAAGGETLVLLNQDTVVQPGWLASLARALETLPDAGVVGAKILDPDGRTLQHAGGYVQHPLALGQHLGYGEIDEGQYDELREVEYVTAASMAIKREVLADIGELDTGFFPGYFEDVDFCYRARQAGYAVWYSPEAVLHHLESASMRRDSFRGHCAYYRNRLRFALKSYSVPRLVQEFVPAELARITGAPREEIRAAALSAVEGIATWALVAEQRRPSPTAAEYEAVASGLRLLQEVCLRLAATGRPWGRDEHTGQAASTAESLASLLPTFDGGHEMVRLFENEWEQGMRPELEGLNDTWLITPRPFTSDVPALAPLIVAFRNWVNDLAGRWYVQGLLEQQVEFNAHAARLALQYSDFLGRMAHIAQQQAEWLQQHDEGVHDQGQASAFLAEQVASLQRQVSALGQRVAELEDELHGRKNTGANRDRAEP